MKPTRQTLRFILLLLVIAALVALFLPDWLELNPYRNLRAEDVKAIGLCEPCADFDRPVMNCRIEDRQFIQDAVEAICRPKLKKVCHYFGAVPMTLIFFGKDDRLLFGVRYHPDEQCGTFRKIVVRNGELYDITGIESRHAVVGQEIEDLIVAYLDKHNLSRELIYGKTTSIIDLKTGNRL